MHPGAQTTGATTTGAKSWPQGPTTRPRQPGQPRQSEAAQPRHCFAVALLNHEALKKNTAFSLKSTYKTVPKRHLRDDAGDIALRAENKKISSRFARSPYEKLRPPASPAACRARFVHIVSFDLVSGPSFPALLGPRFLPPVEKGKRFKQGGHTGQPSPAPPPHLKRKKACPGRCRSTLAMSSRPWRASSNPLGLKGSTHFQSGRPWGAFRPSQSYEEDLLPMRMWREGPFYNQPNSTNIT